MSKIYVAGSLNMDLTICTDDVPAAGETVHGYGFITNPGGKGSNQAAAAARLGGEVEMIGSVGSDGFGRELKAALESSGAHTQRVRALDGVSTGVAMIIVSEGDNRIILDAGANGSVTGRQIVDALADAEAGDLLIMQLEVPQEAVLEGLTAAKAKGVITVLNPAPAAALSDAFFKVTDILVPNEHECARMCGIEPVDEATLLAAGEYFLARGVQHLIVTLGSRGAALVDRNGLWSCGSRRVKAVDSTAAGDCFIGAMASALAARMPLKDAIFRGTRAGALAVTRMGAQQSLPYTGELEAFMAEEKA